MNGLNVIGMVISPRPAHTFRIFVVWHDVVVVGELDPAEGAHPLLFHNLPVENSPHLGGRAQFAVSARVMIILDALDTQADELRSLGQ